MSRKLAETIADLSPEQRKLLELKLKKKRASSTKQVDKIGQQRPDRLPLSFAQQRLWFLYQLDPDSIVYNIHTATRMEGALNIDALHRSFNEIVRRHEVLRTTFAVVDGHAQQIITPELEVPLPVVDMQHVSDVEKTDRIQELAIEEAHRPFDLGQGPLFRATLVKLAQEDYVMLLTMHHIISDEWSNDLFWAELKTLYNAFSKGQPSPLPDLSLQYADFAYWQRQWLQGDVYGAQLNYWKQQLSGQLSNLQLPTDRPRPKQQTYQGSFQSLVISTTLTEKLKILTRQERTTLFMTLLAAFNVLLYRYTGQTDILLGSPIANRNRVEFESLIGFFLNTLVLRTDLSGNPSFRELLHRVREVTLNASNHQDLPFEKLVEELKPDRDLSHNPLFQVTFVFRDSSTTNVVTEFSNLKLSSFKVENHSSHFDLTLYGQETKQGLRLSINYNTDLFEASTITRMLGHFQTLLEGVVMDPQQHLSDLPLLAEAEYQQLLVAWNETQKDYPRYSTIHQLFEAQVERTPDAIAVVYESRQLTYRELNARANQLAHYLKKRGVGPEVLVGFCLERSLEMVIGQLGILKAGGAYVPLDPAYPTERLAFMIEDSRMPQLLTQERLLEILPKRKANVIRLDKEWEAISQQSEENLNNEARADNLAYVMYTSGSTGTPKGVSIPHRAISRLVFNTNYIELGPGDIVGQASNTSFDAATFEIWGALLHGARLVGITKDVILSPRQFTEQIRRQEISTLFLTTALFNQLAQKVPSTFQSIRHLLFGGEAVDPRWVKEVLENGPPRRLLHVYGPTESTTFASWYLAHKVSVGTITIPIGRPIANTQIYLLDYNLQPVPVGIPGELYIGGDGLARDYLNQPELTAEKFMPNPFGDEPGMRLYKTGDLARYLPDGNIEFLGRIDNQVKIRGFRIELGEIEAVLKEHPAVREAVVTTRENTPGDKRLVAFFVPKQGQSPVTDELRDFLRRRLPDYMVPSSFVMLAQLPLTTNGKVDRRSLPEPDHIRQDSLEAYVAPRSDLELQLTKIWENLLNVHPIGVHDNFFDLGGHSLLAVRLFAEIEKTFRTNLPLATLFQGSTVADLAKSIAQTAGQKLWTSLVEIQPLGSKPVFFCVHGGTGDVLWFRELAHHLGKDQPLYGLQSRGLDGFQEPFTRIEDMAAHYISEIRTVQPEGPYLLGGYCFGGEVAYEMAQQLQAQGEQVSLLAIISSTPNTGYHKVPWGFHYFKGFLSNIPYWITHLQELEIREIFARIRRRVRVFRKRISPQSTLLEAADILEDISELPEHRRRIIELNSYGSKTYDPQRYNGHIHVFQPRTPPLLAVDAPGLGWDHLVSEDNFTLNIIPGSHQTIFKEPHVQYLAKELTKAIDDFRQVT